MPKITPSPSKTKPHSNSKPYDIKSEFPAISSAEFESEIDGDGKSCNTAKSQSRATSKANKDNSTSKSPGNRVSRPWTPEEKVLIFETVIKKGAGVRQFEGLIENRTGHQCYMSWHNTFEPAIKKFLGGH